MEEEISNKKKPIPNDRGFTDIVLSWSLEQIENQDLFKDKVCLCFNQTFSFFFCFNQTFSLAFNNLLH